MMMSAVLTTDRVTVRGFAPLPPSMEHGCYTHWTEATRPMSPNQPPYRPFQLLHAPPTTIRPLVVLVIIIHLSFCRCRRLSPRIEPICWSDNQGNEQAPAVSSARPRLKETPSNSLYLPLHTDLFPRPWNVIWNLLLHYNLGWNK